jgi:PAS domain S-box-containing protein
MCSKSKADNNANNYEWYQNVQRTFDNVGVAVFAVDKESCLQYVNDAAVKHFGYSREELLDVEIVQLDCGYTANSWLEHLRSVRRLQHIAIESCHQRKDGMKQAVHLSISFFRQRQYELFVIIVLNSSDQSELHSDSGNVACQKDSLRLALDAISDGSWDRNLQTGQVYYSDQWATVLGYAPEDLYLGRISWESLLHPDDRKKTLDALRKHIDGVTERYEAVFRMKNNFGDWQWIRARGKVVAYDDNGVPLRLIGTHTDITVSKKIEDSTLKSSEKIRMFAYSVAHDLKNPALVIRNLAERYSEKFMELSMQQRQMYWDRIIDSAEQIVQLVENINAYITSRETSKIFEEVPLKEIVQSSWEEFAAQLQYRSITWQVFTGNPVFKMDRLSMIRVLRNLVENSLKYGGPQLSRIAIGYHETSGYHILSVRDNGVGMAIEDSERVFQPFERRVNSHNTKGSGLGLAIVKEIATSHRGEVWIEPNRKRGITFCFAISKNL